MSIVKTLFGGSALATGDHLVSVGLPKPYAYVIFVAVISIFMILWMGIQVRKARKRFNVEYPKMYSEKDEFNCYQRAHLHTLENYPQFLILLFVGGLEMPVLCAIAGLIWIAGRVSYALGYYTGNPKNRMRGGYLYSYIGLLILLFATIKFSWKLAFMEL